MPKRKEQRKGQANPIAPLDLPGSRTSHRTTGAYRSLVIVIFSSFARSLTLEHITKRVGCGSHILKALSRRPEISSNEHVFIRAVGKALEHSITPYFETSHSVVSNRTRSKNALGHPPGIEFSTKTTDSALLPVPLKVFVGVLLQAPILAEEMIARDLLRIKIGCAFFVTFFAQAKKVNQTAPAAPSSPPILL